MKKKVKLSVVVPCFNESKSLQLLAERFQQVKPKDTSVELVLVNNGSTDNSKEIMRGLSNNHNFIRMVDIPRNIGYGHGIWSGLKKASGEYLCWTHADMQTDLGDAIRAYKTILIQKNPKECFVKGNRKGRSIADRIFTAGMSVFEAAILKKALYDINAQPNLFHKNFLKGIKDPPTDFSFDLYCYYIAREKNYKIVRFPVIFKKRVHGASKWNTGIKSKIKFIRRTMEYSFKLKKRMGGKYN